MISNCIRLSVHKVKEDRGPQLISHGCKTRTTFNLDMAIYANYIRVLFTMNNIGANKTQGVEFL